MELESLRAIARAVRRCVIRWTAALFARRRPVTTRSALVIAPHPDDEVFGTGGMIALKRSAGTRVDIVFLTDGEGSHRNCCDTSPVEIAGNRHRLAREAGGILGLEAPDMHWLGLPDGQLPRASQKGFEHAVTAVLELLRCLAPEEVYCPHPLDAWADHAAASEIVGEAARRYGSACDLLYYLVWAWHNLSLRKLPALGWRGARRLDIRPVFEKKQAAMERYIGDCAPACGRPYVGVLPHGFLEPFGRPYEVLFERKVRP